MPDTASNESATEKIADAKPLEDQQPVTRHSVVIGGERDAASAERPRPRANGVVA